MAILNAKEATIFKHYFKHQEVIDLFYKESE